MSGEVTLLDGADGSVSRLVGTAATLFDQPGFGPAALVGGLGVTVRLGTVHRATNDVDTVADGDGPRELALVYLGEADAPGTDRIELDGITVDVMPTWPLPAVASDLPDDDLDRLFVLGHRWALETARAVSITVANGRETLVEASLRVAIAPALVACKLHAIADRRDASASKRESDALDLVRLARDLVGSPGAIEQFSTAPFDLTELVRERVDKWFVRNSTRFAGLLRLAAGSGDASMKPDDVAAIGTLFSERISAIVERTGARGR